MGFPNISETTFIPISCIFFFSISCPFSFFKFLIFSRPAQRVAVLEWLFQPSSSFQASDTKLCTSLFSFHSCTQVGKLCAYGYSRWKKINLKEKGRCLWPGPFTVFLWFKWQENDHSTTFNYWQADYKDLTFPSDTWPWRRTYFKTTKS